MSRDPSSPRYVDQGQMERLAAWSMRKPVIALMGEFSAGKSTLMNLLLGENLLPTQVTATRMPPVWIKYGTEAAYRVDRAGKRHPVEIMTPGSIPLEDTRFIRLHCTADLLRHCDLMDTPGISDPNIKPDDLLRTVRYANSVMWCSHAGQAWRESERGAWEGLPERLRETSILLVTRKDKIETEIDLRKIDRRLERETSHLFNARIFVSLTDAIHARETGDEALLDTSGAKQFRELLEKVIEGIYLQRSYQLARYTVGSAPLEAVLPATPVASEQAKAGASDRTEAPSVAEEQSGDEQVHADDEAMPNLRSSGSNTGIADYRLRSPDAEPATTGRRVDLASYRLKDPLHYAPPQQETEAEANETVAAMEVEAAEQSDELLRTKLVWESMTRQFDVSRTPRLATAIAAVLADLQHEESLQRRPMAARA